MNAGGQLVNLVQQLQSHSQQQLDTNRSLQSQSTGESKFQTTLQDRINQARDQKALRQTEANKQERTNQQQIKNSHQNQQIQRSNQQEIKAKKGEVEQGTELDEQKLEKLRKKLEQGEEISEKDIKKLLDWLQKLSTQLQDELESLETEGEAAESLVQLLEQFQQQFKELNGATDNKQGKTLQINDDKLLDLLNQKTKIKNQSNLADLKSLQDNLKQILKQMEQLNNSKLKLGDKYGEVKQLLEKLNGKLGETKVDRSLVDQLKAKQALEQRAVEKGKLARMTHQQQNKSNQQVEQTAANRVAEQSAKDPVVNLQQTSGDQKSVQLSQLFDNQQNENLNKMNILNLAAANQEENSQTKIKISQNLSTNLEMFTSTNSSNFKNIQGLQNSFQTANSKKTSFQNILQQVDQKMDFFAAKRGKKVTLQLEPKSLGKLQMKIGVEDGTLSAKVVAESGQVKEMLDGNLAKLKQALGEKNIHIDQFEVTVDEEGQGLAGQEFGDSRQQFAFQQGKQQHQQKKEDVTLEDIEIEEVEETGGEAQEPRLAAQDSVDYVV